MEIILLIMCIARMVYLALPCMAILLGIQTVVYRTTGLSPINEIRKFLMRGVE